MKLTEFKGIMEKIDVIITATIASITPGRADILTMAPQ